MTDSGKSVIVIGGGLSGLSASTLLTKQGFRVTLIEQKNRLGGRTFSFEDSTTSETIDNGQHVMMGCYVYTLRWLGMLGQTHHLESADTIRIPFAEPRMEIYPLVIPDLPMPFHLVAGIFRFKNLSIRERFSLLKTASLLSFQTIDGSMSVDNWLTSVGQSEHSKKYFWYPVCLAVMNATAVNASAKLFIDALKQMFLVKHAYSKIMIPKVGLSELFAKPSERVIKENSGCIILNQAVERINVEKDTVTGITLKDGGTMQADRYLSAVHPGAFKKLFEPETIEAHFKDMMSYKTSPILSIYLWFNGPITDRLFDGPFIGCINTHIQWVFKKSDTLLEVTISDGAEIVDWDRKKIIDMVLEEMQSLFPEIDRASVKHHQIIKERLATFNPGPGSEKFRPSTVTSIKNFFLAGDWTDTGLPSTIESAVKSGFAAANCIFPSKRGGQGDF